LKVLVLVVVAVEVIKVRPLKDVVELVGVVALLSVKDSGRATFRQPFLLLLPPQSPA
jgi:hypothetical protein